MLQAFTGKVLLLFLSLWEIWIYYQFLYATCIEKTQLLKWQRVVMQISIWSTGVLMAINRSILFFSNTMFLFIIILVVFSVVVWIFAATKKKISRREGIAMVAMYLVYAVYIILR